MMTALLLSAYSQGLYASRRIAKACEERVDFMAVTARQSPDFRTISGVRKRHLSALGGLFTQALQLCLQAGIGELGLCRIGGDEDPRQRFHAQGDELQPDEDRRTGVGRRGHPVAGSSGGRRRARGRGVWSRPARGRAAGVGGEQATPLGEDPRRERGIGSRRTGRRKGQDTEGRSPRESPSTRPPWEESSRHTPRPRNFTDPDSRIMKAQDGFIQG